MTRGSKSQYGCRLSLKPCENEEHRRSTGRPYEKIPQKELTLIIVEEEEFSTPTDDPELEEASLDMSQLTFELSTCSLLGLM